MKKKKKDKTTPKEMVEMLRVLASVMEDRKDVKVEVLPELLTQVADMIEDLADNAS